MARGGGRDRHAVKRLIVRAAYWRQYVWFYVWKWTMRWPWLHAQTIGPVNHARLDYLDVHRRWWTP